MVSDDGEESNGLMELAPDKKSVLLTLVTMFVFPDVFRFNLYISGFLSMLPFFEFDICPG